MPLSQNSFYRTASSSCSIGPEILKPSCSSQVYMTNTTLMIITQVCCVSHVTTLANTSTQPARSLQTLLAMEGLACFPCLLEAKLISTCAFLAAATVTPHKFRRGRKLSIHGCIVTFLYLCAFGFYLYVRIAKTLDLGSYVWYGAIVLAIEIAGATTTLVWCLNIVMDPVHEPLRMDTDNPGLTLVRGLTCCCCVF